MTTHDDDSGTPRDDVADRVLARLVATLPADEARPGDSALVARNLDAVLAKSSLGQPSNVVSMASRKWAPLAVAASLAVAAAAMAFTHRQSTLEGPADKGPPVVATTPAPTPPSPAVPSPKPTEETVPTLDVSSLPSAAIAAPSASPRKATTEERSAATLFTLANDARRARDVATARSLYRELQAKYPRSPEAVTSYVTLGRLELDSARANEALLQFDRYLGTGAVELREDAMAGRASALENLGRNADEKAAWQALLAAYPSSLFAPHAKQRLSRLP
ncbi:tetratricopeptide repeat protein [Labilithrix luteola]|nr:hypothetical protein [Labilithrix luteola]